jgi:Berberine and berberine like
VRITKRLQRVKAEYDPDNLFQREPQHRTGALTASRDSALAAGRE